MTLVQKLTDRAASYKAGGPSSEHTADLLIEAAVAIERLQHDLLYAYRCVDDGFTRGKFDFSVLRGRARAVIRAREEEELAASGASAPKE